MKFDQQCVFSVIMPCYNSEPYLEDAVKSLLAQTFSGWELIAINDGSVDNTFKILESYAEKDQRIRVFSKENGGYATAISYGLDKIRGKYFLMMGSDDKLYPTLFEEIAKRVLTTEPDIVCFRTAQVKNKQIIGYADRITEEIYVENTSLKEIEENYADICSILFSRDTSKCYKSKLLFEQRMLGTTGLDADSIFSMVFCHKISSVLFLPVVGYHWTLRGDSISGRLASLQDNTDRLSNWKAFFNYLLKLPQKEICKTESSYLRYVADTVFYYLPCVKLYDFKQLNFIRSVNRLYLKTARKCNIPVPFKTVFQMKFVFLTQLIKRTGKRFSVGPKK